MPAKSSLSDYLKNILENKSTRLPQKRVRNEYRRDAVSKTSAESFALESLSTAVHAIKFDGMWQTLSVTENVSSVLGVSSKSLADSAELWMGRIHPADIDVVRAALQTVSSEQEKNITYRFRDAQDRYRWIGYKCKKSDDTVIGFVTDISTQRTKDYADRVHLAGRESLSTLIESSDLTASIQSILRILGTAFVVNRARLVRFRTDDRAFITHEWVRNNSIEVTEVPEPVQREVVLWSKAKLEQEGQVVIESCADSALPEPVKQELNKNNVGAIMAIPAIINGKVEAFVCFDVPLERMWLPSEIEEAMIVFKGYSRAVERRIEDRKQASEEFQLRRSEEQYRLVTSHSPVVLFGIDSKGYFTLSEGQGLENMDADAGDVVGQSVYHVYRNHPEVLLHVNQALGGTETHGRVNIAESIFEVWFTPVYDEDKIVVGISGVAVEITLRHQLEEQQTIMMSELDHRVKNNIVAVMSLVNLSQQNATTIEEFAKTLDGRLHALAVAHSTLAKSHWRGAWMRDILTLTLQPYMAGSEQRIQFEGPDVELKGILVRPMCMVIHELATNAVKYGSLSNVSGTVMIKIENFQDGAACRLTWQELNGPPITGEPQSGTGTSLVEGLISHELNGTIQRVFEQDGFHCQIEFPLEESN